MQSVKVNTVVLGAGPGGYVAGIKLGQLGVDTLVVDKQPPGGVCLNMGCIPSKALIHAADVVEEARHAAEMGITFAEPQVDMNKLIDWKDGIVKKLNGGVAGLFKGNGVKWLQGEARFTGPKGMEVQTADGLHSVEFENCIVAAGARPIELKGLPFDGKRIFNAWDALDIRSLPKHLLVVGGGVIGLEMGTVFAKLGSELTVVEATDALLPGTDPDLVRVVERGLKKRGVKILKETFAMGFEPDGERMAVKLKDAKSGEESTVACDVILVGIGFRPNSEKLGLNDAGVEVDERGFVKIDDQLRTNVPGIYAIGDITGGPLLAHKASKEGELAAEIIAGHRRSLNDVLAIPAAVFTDPEVATVGLDAAAAKERFGDDVAVGTFNFGALGRAMSTQRTDGQVKLVTQKSTGRVLGGGIVGAAASDLIAEITLAVELGATAEDLGLTVHAHPTMAEAVMEAALASRGEAIHKINR